MRAGEIRKTDPLFSKTDVFVAGVMEEWYARQSNRLASPRLHTYQSEMEMGTPQPKRTVLQALEQQVRREFNELIAGGELDHDHYVGGRMLEECILEKLPFLPNGVLPGDAYRGSWQLPEPALE